MMVVMVQVGDVLLLSVAILLSFSGIWITITISKN